MKRKEIEEGSANPRALKVIGSGLLGAAVMSIGWAGELYPLCVLVFVWIAVEVILTAEPDARQSLEFFS